jgi:2,3-bisphosphoglycerate-dependent phosphoglycerate mutase
MCKPVVFIITLFLLSCKATTYYVVRHAEKAPATTMTSDVPLSGAGQQRAQALKELLQKEHIQHIFSTNYIRTKSTVQPLADALKLPVEIYDPKDAAFLSKLKTLRGTVLIVGHSNTVDDLVNGLSGQKEIEGDLPDSEYGDLFVVKKKGNRIVVERKHFGN